MRCFWLTLGMLGFAGVISAAAPPTSPSFSAEELAKAQQAIELEVAGSVDPVERAVRLARLALFKRPGGALQYLADKAFRTEIGVAQSYIPKFFAEGDAQAKTEILDLYHDSWKTLGVANDSWTMEMVREGLEHPDWKVRRAAARLMAERPISNIANWAIDAAEAEPILTQAALMAISAGKDETGARWATTKLADEDPLVRAAAKRAVVVTRERSKIFLKEQIDNEKDSVRRAAMDAFLIVATPDDVPFLQDWAARNQRRDPDLEERVTRAVAELEAGAFKSFLPPNPDLVLPEKAPHKEVKGQAGKR